MTAECPTYEGRSQNGMRQIHTYIYLETEEQDKSNVKSLPPWNPSPHIDKEGFLTCTYKHMHGQWEYENEYDNEGEPQC